MGRILFQPVTDDASITFVASMAGVIWREHYAPLIGNDQVEYMLEKFQSAMAISEQIQAGYQYYMLCNGPRNGVGYLAVIPRENEVFLSKIYLARASRGKGYARQAIEYVEAMARAQHLSRITLTVNRRNCNSIKAYQKMGFAIYDSLTSDIGNGFVMDDYAMQKSIA